MNTKHSLRLLALGLAALLISTGLGHPAQANVGLANPAAEYCLSQGGLYGLRDDTGGKRGICRLANGEEVDAWAYFRGELNETTPDDETQRANPAATYCAALGGTYRLDTSTCLLPDGRTVDAWDQLRRAHAASLANPSAAYCLEIGGAYEVRAGEDGAAGICRLPDGREEDAWMLFRRNH